MLAAIDSLISSSKPKIRSLNHDVEIEGSSQIYTQILEALIANDNSWRVDGYAQGEKAKICKSGKKSKMHFTSTSQKFKAWPKAFLDVKKAQAKSSQSSMKIKDISQYVCLNCGKQGHWKCDCRMDKVDIK